MNFQHVAELWSLETDLRIDGRAGQPTGIADLDQNTGGLKAGDVWLVAARPQMGNQMFALRIALHAAKANNVPALIYSGHMAPEAVVLYLIERQADAIRESCGQKEMSLSLLQTAEAELGQMPLFIASDWVLNLSAIETAVTELGVKSASLGCGNGGVVIIDSLQMLKATTSLSLSEIASGLKRIAQERGITILMTYGLKRKLEHRRDRRPRLGDIGGYGTLCPWIDHFVFLYRDEVYYPDSDDKELEISGHSRRLVRKYWLPRVPSFLPGSDQVPIKVRSWCHGSV